VTDVLWFLYFELLVLRHGWFAQLLHVVCGHFCDLIQIFQMGGYFVDSAVSSSCALCLFVFAIPCFLGIVGLLLALLLMKVVLVVPMFELLMLAMMPLGCR